MCQILFLNFTTALKKKYDDLHSMWEPETQGSALPKATYKGLGFFNLAVDVFSILPQALSVPILQTSKEECLVIFSTDSTHN